MSEQVKPEGFKPCPFCGGKGVLREMDGDYYVRCENCGGRGPNNFFHMEQAALDWNRRTIDGDGKAMSLAGFAAKHSRLIGIIEECAGKEKAALIICLERKNQPRVGVHQYKIHGVDTELNDAVNDLLAYCLSWLDDTKGSRNRRTEVLPQKNAENTQKPEAVLRAVPGWQDVWQVLSASKPVAEVKRTNHMFEFIWFDENQTLFTRESILDIMNEALYLETR